MANTGTIDSEVFYLHHQWPVHPNARLGEPEDGFTGAGHFNVSEAVGLAAGHRLGECRLVPTTSLTNGIKGEAIFTYLKVGVQHADSLIAAKSACGQASIANWAIVSNGVSVVYSVAMTPVAIALAAMTDGNCGFFWTGGCCPEDYVAALAGNYITDDTVVYGQMVPAAGAGTLHTLVWRVQAANELASGVGFCLVATDTQT